MPQMCGHYLPHRNAPQEPKIMTPEAEAIMSRACVEMAAEGERCRAARAAIPPRPRLTVAEIFAAMQFQVIDRMPRGADPDAFMSEVARIGITEQLHARLLDEQGEK